MGKKSRRKVKQVKEQMPFIARTFEGLPGECDLIAMREMVPSATANVTLKDSDRVVRVCSLLPGASAGIARPDGEIWVGLQTNHNFGDVSRDLAHVIELGLETEPGNPIIMTDPGVGPRLQDVLDLSAPFDVTVHDGFDFWVEGADDSEQMTALLGTANESINPTVRLNSVEAAYWTEIGERRFLRWVMPHDENTLLNALARLRQRGEDVLGDDIRLIGSFRTHGLLVPVWEMPADTDAADLEKPTSDFANRLEAALADRTPLTPEERSARNGLANRQLTIR
ncbi:MAG: DUF5926 family protein [Actinomycetota bacterium]|nr:DUF5926 family protein [Actinomycetota bacterium]